MWSAVACHRFLSGEARLASSSDQLAPTSSGGRLKQEKKRAYLRPADTQR
jgi:hypothetical protein